MTSIPFGIIGTNWITHDYVSHAHATGKWKLAAVYSRKQETAKGFASRYEGDIALHTSIEDIANDANIKSVYIASPNSLHYEHAHAMLSAGKHVVVEKPATCTSAQLSTLFELAYAKKLILVEAFRHIHEANFKILKQNIARLGPISGATFSFCQFSSKYDAMLRGEAPNVFSLEFGGGALTDLGVYNVAAAVELFGEPVKSTYYPAIVATGADGAGTLVLQYEGFVVNLLFSKMYYSAAPSEIYGERGTLSIPSVTDIASVTFWDPRKKAREELGGPKVQLNLQDEAEEHARLIMENDVQGMERWERHSKGVIKITEGVRRDTGLLFPVERRE